MQNSNRTTANESCDRATENSHAPGLWTHRDACICFVNFYFYWIYEKNDRTVS